MKLFGLFTICILSTISFAQVKTINTPFKPGEKLTYVVSYNMKGIKTELAGINMEVIDVPGKKKPINRLKFTVNTPTSWDDYVKVRHAYQTYIDVSSLRPLLMAQDSDIKGQITKAKYKFKTKSNLAELEVTKNNDPTYTKTIHIKKNTFDVVSLLYYSRSINYSAMTIGNSTPLNLLILERLVDLELKLVKKENIEVKGMGLKPCYKVAVILSRKFVVEPDVNYIWFTADENQIPVQIETKYKEGKALVKLIDYQAL